MITCIVPARGGSKGIPRKNLAMVCGKPLLGWTLEQALASELIDEVIVSTDCHEIGEYATQVGAQWMLRSDETSTDNAPTEAALLEVMEVLDYTPELFVLLQATSPIRQPEDIDASVRRVLDTGCDSLFSARHVEGYTWTVGSAVTPNYFSRQRRQVQAVRRLEENGSIYVFTPHVLRHYRCRLGGRVEYYEMHPLDSFQVDTQEDIATIEQVMPVRLEMVAA